MSSHYGDTEVANREQGSNLPVHKSGFVRQIGPRTAQQLKVRLTRFPGLYARTRLPYSTARFLARRPHDTDYAVFGLFPQTDGLFLDVGANAGMSALSFRIYQRRASIFAVEPNPYHEADLKWVSRVVRRMEYGIWAAGDEVSESEFFIPVYRGVPITAEASLSAEFVRESPSLKTHLGERMNGAGFEIVQRRVAVRPLDDLDLKPAFVKLDVQGHEHSALIGMIKTLEKYGPPVLVEAPADETKALMETLGYSAYEYDHSTKTLLPLTRPVDNVFFTRELPGVRASAQ